MRLLLNGITHSYGPTEVLRDVSFTVEDAEIVCIIGPSGCGKSTLLRFLGGLEKPDGGAVLMSGNPPEGSLNPLTYVFQDFALLPWRTVEGNISLVLEDHGIRGGAARAVIDGVLARTKLSDFRKAWPRQLSGGMKQRVAIARAFAIDADLILMDEPFVSLDQPTRERMQREVLHTWEHRRRTVVFVTHNLEEAVFLGDRVIVLSAKPARIVATVDVKL
ncbi:MAG: ABC transporter ATP-binding protein, partial [Paracoccaceae bacterium]|nr:ABC transporter ATP-binding protein [Paracoccaceae bacterium]